MPCPKLSVVFFSFFYFTFFISVFSLLRLPLPHIQMTVYDVNFPCRAATALHTLAKVKSQGDKTSEIKLIINVAHYLTGFVQAAYMAMRCHPALVYTRTNTEKIHAMWTSKYVGTHKSKQASIASKLKIKPKAASARRKKREKCECVCMCGSRSSAKLQRNADLILLSL